VSADIRSGVDLASAACGVRASLGPDVASCANIVNARRAAKAVRHM